MHHPPQPPLIEAFLHDVFDVFDVNEIEDLQSVIDVKEQSLNYSTLFTHPRILWAAGFIECWRTITGGVDPSRYDIWAFLHEFKPSVGLSTHPSMDTVVNWIAKQTFIKYVLNHPMMTARVVSMSWRLPPLSSMREFIIEKLANRYGKTFDDRRATVMQAYKSIIEGIDFRKDVSEINRQNLLSLNPLTGFYVLTPRANTISKGVCSILDCARYVIGRDPSFGYRTFDKTAVFNAPNDLDLPYNFKWPRVSSQAPNSTGDGFHRVFTADQQHIVNYAVPRWFHTALIFGSGNGSSQGIQAMATQKNLILVPQTSSSLSIPPPPPNTQAEVRVIHLDHTSPVASYYSLPMYSHPELAMALLKMHLKHDCPIAKPTNTTQHHALVAFDRIARLYKKEPTEQAQPQPQPQAQQAKKYAIVLVDNRANIFSAISCHITLNNLKRDLWDTLIITRKQHIAWYEARVPGAKVTSNVRLEEEPFDIETYNLLLKDPDFWQPLEIYNRVLVIQDDGMLTRPGLEARFIQYDYVGSPWIHNEVNQELIMMNKGLLVGNGGLSLRNPRVMREICQKFAKEGQRLFNNQLQPIPEDVFFSHCVAMKMSGKATTPENKEATLFATEQVENPMALGFHKFWAYQPIGNILKYFA